MLCSFHTQTAGFVRLKFFFSIRAMGSMPQFLPDQRKFSVLSPFPHAGPQESVPLSLVQVLQVPHLPLLLGLAAN